MAKDTKERILEAALDIFSRDGYEGTNIRDIAEAVGIVKSALYRHFESKEAIWNAARDMIAAYYDEHFGSSDRLPPIPQSPDELYETTMQMVNFTIHDPRIIRMRKILNKEQFRDAETRKLASMHFLYNTEAIYTQIFTKMMEKGIMKKADPAILAFSYTAPITALIHLCDRQPEKEPEVMERLTAFIRQFITTYGESRTGITESNI